ncbi:MAG: glycosyltransferase family 9 protein [Syntrophothermus sp.]
MKLKTKIYLDNLFGPPAVFFLDMISKMLFYLNHKKEQNYLIIRRIAVCKFYGMGSIIQSTPLLMTLRNRYPKAEIVFITLPKNAGLLSTFPFIDKIQVVDDRSFLFLSGSLLKLLFKQWATKTDVLIDLEVHSHFSRILTFLCFPKYKFGFYKRKADIHLGIYTKMVFFNTKAPLPKIYLQTSLFLDCKNTIEDLYDWSGLTKELPTSGMQRLSGQNIPEIEYFVINPNASDLRIERMWDPVNYIDLIDRILCNYPDVRIVLTGSQEESQYVEKLYNGIKDEHRSKVVNSSGKLTLKELIVLISGCKIMVANDSGPMHIAIALRKNIVALFGPCPPQDYTTYPNVYSIYKNLYCSPCVHHFAVSPCKGDNKCMKMISTAEVMKAVCEIMDGNSAPGRDKLNNRIIYKSDEVTLALGIAERSSWPL